MTQDQSKQILPELVIIGAALFAVWSLVVSPMRDGLSRAKAAHASAIEHTRIAGDPDLSTPRLTRVRDSIDMMIGDIETRSDIARDQTALQARLMVIGEEAGIRIERVNPAKTRPMNSGAADDRVVSFELECSGRYTDIAGFVARLEDSIGLSAIERLSIRPNTSASGSAVRARLRTLHFVFDTSPPPVEGALASTAGGLQ